MQRAAAPAEAVRDSFAAVFQSPAYDRSLRETLWSRVVAWFTEWYQRLSEAMGASPAAYWTARVLLVLVAAAIVARLGYVAWARWRARDPLRAAALARRGGAGGDPWERAQAEAAAGRYTEAAHLLYEALLRALAGRERLRLHPSKTAGDYARELRSRASPAFPSFREFARGYETVVYDLQHCDRERFEQLRRLAAPLVAAPVEARG